MWVKASVEECARRDVKGPLRQGVRRRDHHFTGVDDPYEEPDDAEIVADTVGLTPEQSIALVLAELERIGVAPAAIPAS